MPQITLGDKSFIAKCLSLTHYGPGDKRRQKLSSPTIIIIIIIIIIIKGDEVILSV